MSDPTDPGGVGAAQNERLSRTTARAGDSGSPVGSPLTIVLSLIAVVVGFLIFRSIDSGGSSAAPSAIGNDPSAVTTTVAGATPTAAPTTAAPAVTERVTEGADVIVINAGEVPQSAGAISDLLKDVGYSMVEPAVSDDNDTPDEDTVVMYSEGTTNNVAQTVAQSVANDLGVTAVEPAPSGGPAIADGDSLGSATVFVMLGQDKATITSLAPQAPEAPALPTTTAPA